MNTRSMAAWVLLSIALIAGYWYTGTLEVEEKRKAFEAKKLFDFEGKDIVRLSFTTRENDTIEAARLGENKWKLDEPFAHVTPNHALWTDLAEKVVPILINERDIETDPNNLAIYLLEDPPLTVVIETSRKELIQLDIGMADPTGNNHYAKLASGEVFLLPAPMANALYRSLNDLRDKRVFPDIEYGLDRIHYTRYPVDDPNDGIDPEPGIDEEYTLADDGKWRITQPVDLLAFQGEMRHVTNQIKFLAGDDFIDDPDPLADYGLDPPWAKLTVMNSEEDAQQTLSLGWLDDQSDSGKMFVNIDGNPTVFTIDAGFLGYLPDAPLDFREDHIVTAEPSNIAKIEYTDSRNTFTLTEDEVAGWQLTDPPYSDTDNLRVSNLITGLVRIQGSRFPDEEEVAASFGGERIRYTFHFKDGSPSTSVVIGGPVPDTIDPPMFYVRQDFGSVTTIPLQFRTFLTSNPFRFRNPELLPFDIKSTTAVSIEMDGTTYRLSEENGFWNVTEPSNHIIENIADLATIIKSLRQVYAVNAEDPALSNEITGLDAPVLEASVTWSTPQGSQTVGPIRLGKLETNKSRYRFASVEGRPETFRVDHSLIENLRKGLQGIKPVQPN